MIFSTDVIFKEFRAYLGEEPKEMKNIVHFETKVEKQEDAHVEEQLDESKDGEEEESSKSLDDVQYEHTEEQ